MKTYQENNKIDIKGFLILSQVFKTNHISWYNNNEKTVRCLLTPFIELTIGSKALIIQRCHKTVMIK